MLIILTYLLTVIILCISGIVQLNLVIPNISQITKMTPLTCRFLTLPFEKWGIDSYKLDADSNPLIGTPHVLGLLVINILISLLITEMYNYGIHNCVVLSNINRFKELVAHSQVVIAGFVYSFNGTIAFISFINLIVTYSKLLKTILLYKGIRFKGTPTYCETGDERDNAMKKDIKLLFLKYGVTYLVMIVSALLMDVVLFIS